MWSTDEMVEDDEELGLRPLPDTEVELRAFMAAAPADFERRTPDAEAPSE